MKKNIQHDQQIELLEELIDEGYNFFTGVPDSLLKTFLLYIKKKSLPHIQAVHDVSNGKWSYDYEKVSKASWRCKKCLKSISSWLLT